MIVPLREEGTGALLGFAKICRDLSERKAAEDERTRLLMSEKAARQEAEAANVAKDRFLAVLSHELRTPLAPVPFVLSVLENEKLLSSQGRQSVEAVRRNIETVSRLLGDLLDVSRIVHGKMDLSFSPLDIHECVRKALAVAHPAFIAKELKLTVTLEASKHQVFGDMTRLQQIFWNVFQNAAKFSRSNDSVTVSSLQSHGRPHCHQSYRYRDRNRTGGFAKSVRCL